MSVTISPKLRLWAPYAVLSLLSLLWGTSFLFIKIASRTFDPVSLALGRVGVAAAALAVAALAMGLRWPRRPALGLRPAALPLVGQMLPAGALARAGRLTTSADMALMMGAIPIFVFVVARFAPPTERWRLRPALGLLLGLLGVAVALSGSLAMGKPTSADGWGGDALALLAALGYAAGSLMSRPVAREIGVTMTVAASMLASTLMLALAWLVTQALAPGRSFEPAPFDGLVAVVALGLFNTALAYLVYFRLIQTAGATFAGLNNYLVPPLGLLAGAVVLGEPLQIAAFPGLALILCGALMTGPARRGESAAASS